MRKTICSILFFILLLIVAGPVSAGVIIKVRALNPLQTEEFVTINYALPPELTEEDIIKKKINYSMDHSKDEEPPKLEFSVSQNEQDGTLFIDDEIRMLPREVITLEVHVKDVWVIADAQINTLKNEVNKFLKLIDEKPVNDDGNDGMSGEDAGDGGDQGVDEDREIAMLMKEEILDRLDKIAQRQADNSILKVGVEAHITAYNKNLEDLVQVQQDIAILTELVVMDAPQDGDQPPDDGGEGQDEAQDESIDIDSLMLELNLGDNSK